MNATMNSCSTNDASSHCCDAPKQTVRPRADIYELDDAWFVTLDMPGVDEHGADVSIEKNVMTVSAAVDALDTDGWDRRLGAFDPRRYERTFRLPDVVDRSAVEAQVKNGVLKLRLPKSAAALPHKVTVKAG